MKVENLPLVSDAHLGFITGIGEGVGIGFDAGFNLLGLKIGPEFEQVITNVDYSAGINATRFGGFINRQLFDGFYINFHMGKFDFQIKNSDIVYNYNGQDYRLLAGASTYSGVYQAVSIDYLWQGYLFTPKFLINEIQDQGKITEFNLNIGRSF
ncbi:MAG: hypothetical protein ABID35_00880 [Candidatus Margulisiibacteriota bacterium]